MKSIDQQFPEINKFIIEEEKAIEEFDSTFKNIDTSDKFEFKLQQLLRNLKNTEKKMKEK
jgi:hypothetical protein